MAPKTFKPMPEVEEEVLKVGNEQDLITRLLSIEGMNHDMAEHMAEHGVPDDSPTVQTFYRVSAVTADAVIKAFKGAK